MHTSRENWIVDNFRLLLIGGTCVAASLLPAARLDAADPAESKTIGRIVRERADLSRFLTLLDKTEIGSQLSERTDSRYTVFAPVDAAFDKLPEGSVEILLDPKNDDRLEEVFAYHVLTRSEPAFRLEKYSLLRMATGQFLSVDYGNDRIGEAACIGKPIACANGTIYLIDQVLTPKTDDLLQTLQKDGRFTILTRAITASRQGKLFQNMHSLYTAFAPTDAAFRRLPKNVLESLFRPESDERLEDIIKHHIAEGVFSVGKTPGFRSLGIADVTPRSAFGQQINFKNRPNGATVDGAKLTETDIPCANGVIHVIDSVIPPVDISLRDVLAGRDEFSTLVTLLEATGLELPVASSTKFTVFAPTNEAWAEAPYRELAENPTGANRERLFALLARHVIVGKHVAENCVPFAKLRTIHGAPIYLTRDSEKSYINAIPIQQTDSEAFNGLVQTIPRVIPDSLELPESDISTVDAIQFVQTTLKEGAPLYNAGRYEDCWRFHNRRGYEFLSKYRQFLDSSVRNQLAGAIVDDQPIAQFAQDAWASRNAFRTVLRSLEQREDRLQDAYLMQRPEQARFGR